ncbi:MAG: hypothetical protein UW41_C0012G0018 [Candidatus Collierbacteria bacterium GW2011_GWC2_44_18]|uniref:Uncharacterized protein n=1 Tax=Candidatus Collierbacteria bacterium GW2011_GWC2_44_18 TaxID=1618392 RepID=A0A0G1HQ68_9BACT|nr:MAG: hypothetical protein UW16_C0031G0026 [Microgenomates group bacterium GW2011_GWC1_44_10]KKT49080.1 MAG: hypothetical protein UW41_C0012G0018 [Candidatus Collierbacteria bacterium GW2011_GWC2_44_18]
MPELKKVNIYFGGWYQRTTLHLTEIADFFTNGKSDLPLVKERLKKLHEGLGMTSVSREAGYLEFVKAETKEGIEINYFEDGLYVLKLSSSNIDEAKEKLNSYYEEKFAPAVAYIFSLGAPTPKELANIKTVHPIAVGVIDKDPEEFVLNAKYGEIYSTIASPELTVKKTPGFIFLIAKPEYKGFVEGLVEMQIFFREFKDQLQKYLDIHRKLWEEISEIKERKQIRGKEVERVRLQLDAYQKTINLISSRINQMGAYVHTRADIAKEMKLTDHLSNVFQYKFDVLTNTHSYIKEIWVMTNNYLAAAIGVIAEIKGQATNKSIQSLQVITTYGVVGTIINYYLSRESLPKLTTNGMVYFLILVIVTFIVNQFIAWVYSMARYKLKFSERVKNI